MAMQQVSMEDFHTRINSLEGVQWSLEKNKIPARIVYHLDRKVVGLKMIGTAVPGARAEAFYLDDTH